MNKYVIICLCFVVSSCQNKQGSSKKKIDYKSQWVDSIYNDMTLEEKIGQLFMVAAYSNRDTAHSDSIKKMIQTHHLGGLVFFQGSPFKQANLTNDYQSISKTPLLIGIDAEWGVNMRLDSTFRYPYNMTLGAVQDSNLIKKVGIQIGKHCKRLGIHVNFAPVVDINTNPNNPIIGVRSYSEDKKNVATKAIAFTKGLQSEGVLACAKHFPGHGDTDKDSHKTLPTISFSAQRIDSVELYPFKQLFNNGIASVMVAHLNVPSLEKTQGLPSSLSHHITSKVLKESLGFKGIIFTDALNMKGATNYKNPGDIDLAAFEAGNDVLLLSENIPKATYKLIEAYKHNRFSEERLSYSVKRILSAKFEVNLHKYEPVNISNLKNDLNTIDDEILYNTVISKAITLVKNEHSYIPIAKDYNKKIAYLKFGSGESNEFLSTLKSYAKVDELPISRSKKLLKKLKKYDLIIIGYHRSNTRKINQFDKNESLLIEEIAKNNKVILDVFASQYTLTKLSFVNLESVMISYENSKSSQKASAQIIFGDKEVIGKLPASINLEFQTDHGIEIPISSSQVSN